MIELRVFPRPRRVEWVGSKAPVDGAVIEVVDPQVQPEGYELRVFRGSIEIRHSDEAGLRYGRDTLLQLRQQFPHEFPDLIISDWPDTPNRAYMLDISRGRVPTMATLGWLVAVLAACRINQLQLYMEHTFAFAHHETVWRDASPMTAAEMTSLDRLCMANGIELVPCLNVFGHMGRWLKHDRYRDRAECPTGFLMSSTGTHLKPQTLEPTQANADFALDLVNELTQTVASDKVNICCDEAIELGECRSKGLVAERGKVSVFVDHLLRLVEPLIHDGHQVMFWGDMFRLDPEPIARLPELGATALVWQYDPPTNATAETSQRAATPELAELLGLPDDIHLGFQSQTRQLVEADYPFWVAPGTSSWNSLIGRWPESQANLLDAVDVGLAAGAGGVLLTDWGDTGHMQPLSVSVLPIVYAASLSWCAEQNREAPRFSEVDRVVFGAESSGIAKALTTLGGLSSRCSRSAVNGSALFFDLLVDPPLPAFGSTNQPELDSILESLGGVIDDLDRASPIGEQSAEIVAEIRAAARLTRHGAWRSGRLANLDVPSDSALCTDLAEAIEEQRTAWLGRSRPGGLEYSVAILDRTLDTYR